MINFQKQVQKTDRLADQVRSGSGRLESHMKRPGGETETEVSSREKHKYTESV